MFAGRDFSSGDLIERCELILLPLEEVPPSLEAFVYEYRKTIAAVALGNGSLLNHAERANARFTFDYRRQHLIIRAAKAIRKGEEVTINYGYGRSLLRSFGIT